MKRAVSLYILLVPYATASYLVTRGPDGDWYLFRWLFLLLGALYLFAVVPLPPISWLHGFGHTIAYLTASILAYRLEPRLEGLSGFLHYLINSGIVATVVGANVICALVQWIRRRSHPPQTLYHHQKVTGWVLIATGFIGLWVFLPGLLEPLARFSLSFVHAMPAYVLHSINAPRFLLGPDIFYFPVLSIASITILCLVPGALFVFSGRRASKTRSNGGVENGA